ncbi:hypothetical protein ACFU5B_13640 [Streptomyces murinus]|uniref:hypothetical protein n=1 Tax=Streptomyces murinus TaxID=33900 RepID=UPI003644147B
MAGQEPQRTQQFVDDVPQVDPLQIGFIASEVRLVSAKRENDGCAAVTMQLRPRTLVPSALPRDQPASPDGGMAEQPIALPEVHLCTEEFDSKVLALMTISPGISGARTTMRCGVVRLTTDRTMSLSTSASR